MINRRRLLSISLLPGALYFFLVGAAHLVGLKIPGLFVYFDVPSYTYQNMVISLLTFGWSAMFLMGRFAVRQGLIRYAAGPIISGAVAIVIFIFINLSSELQQLAPGGMTAYWLPTVVFGLYWVWLTGVYILAVRDARGDSA